MAARPEYVLIYWPGTPGRGEHVRLAFEEAGVAYDDSAKTERGPYAVQEQISPDNKGEAGGPPPCAPPILQHRGSGRVLWQTANIMRHLGQRLPGLVPGDPDDEDARETALDRASALAMTALDGLSDEVHDCHHPVCTALYYEEQKPEAVRRSQAYVQHRLPKFLGYFERVLAAAPPGGYLLGDFSYADLVLFQCLDGTAHQFPRAVAQLRAAGAHPRVFAHSDAVRARPRIAAYLASPRRAAYGNGLYRYYPELDVVPQDVPSS